MVVEACVRSGIGENYATLTTWQRQRGGGMEGMARCAVDVRLGLVVIRPKGGNSCYKEAQHTATVANTGTEHRTAPDLKI